MDVIEFFHWSSFSHSICEADGYDKKHDKEEKSHIIFLFTNRKYGSQSTKNAISVRRNF